MNRRLRLLVMTADTKRFFRRLCGAADEAFLSSAAPISTSAEKLERPVRRLIIIAYVRYLFRSARSSRKEEVSLASSDAQGVKFLAEK